MEKKNATRIFCGFCGAEKVRDKHGYYTCPGCGSETTPPDKTTAKMIRREFSVQLPCDRSLQVSNEFIHVKSKSSGGSKSKGRSDKKQLLQRPSTTELYKQLCNRPAPKPRREEY